MKFSLAVTRKVFPDLCSYKVFFLFLPLESVDKLWPFLPKSSCIFAGQQMRGEEQISLMVGN